MARARAAPALHAACLALALGCAALAAHAGDELDGLFERLGAAPDAAAAEPLERRIWDLWMQSGDARTDALLERGTAAMEAGGLERAVELFSQVIARAPDFAEGWNKRATAYYLMGEHERSVADIRRTLALEPRHFGALSGMGLIFLARGDLLGALDAFEAVLRIHPRSIAARLHVRRIRERLEGSTA